jgi:hypothetical protein
MTAAPAPITNGFVFDVDKWVASDSSLEAALVRTRLTKSPKAGDAELIQKRIDEILATQKPNGVFGDDIKRTGSTIVKLLELGCPVDRPEVRNALDVMLADTSANAAAEPGSAESALLMPLHNLRAACMAGRTDAPTVRRALQYILDHPNPVLLGGCPWTATMTVRMLWIARKAVNTEPLVRRELRYINDHINDAGCLGYRDPWGFVEVAAAVDLPEAKELLQRLVPLILRTQNPSGGWGGNPESMKNYAIIAALQRHKLFDELKRLPKLPDDWTVVRSINLPAGNKGTLTWDGAKFWLVNWTTGELQAISRDDGAIVKRLPFPDGGCAAVGMWDGKLAVSQGKPIKRVRQLDPETGKVLRDLALPNDMASVGAVTQAYGRIWVGDTWVFAGCALDPQHPQPGSSPKVGLSSPDRLEYHLAGLCPGAFAPTQDGVWHVDNMAGIMLKSGPEGRLLDWAAIPTGWTSGIAWDGEHLWCKTPDGSKLCMVEKTATAPGKVRQPGGEPAYQRDGGVGTRGSNEREGSSDVSARGDSTKSRLGQLSFKGDIYKQDPFSMAMQAACRYFGKAVDYDTIYALSGNCFAPDIRPSEPSHCHWQLQGRERNLDLVCERLGLSFRPFDVRQNPPKGCPSTLPKDAAGLEAWKASYRRPVMEAVERTLRDGSLLLSMGEWFSSPEVLWTEWGLVTTTDPRGTKRRPDGGLCGYASNGRGDNEVDFVRDGYVITQGKVTLEADKAEREVLRRAVARIRGDGKPPFDPRDRKIVFGVAALDAWATTMATVKGFCEPGHPWNCAAGNAIPTVEGSKFSARWLRAHADKQGGQSADHLRAAASHYDRIVALFTPALKDDGPECYRTIIGDLDKQKAHAEKVLKPVKAELALAGDEMAKALELAAK